MSRDDTTLLDILDAARAALEFLGDSDEDTFREDRKTQSAVLHQLILIGEAAKRLSSAFRERHPQIPWKDIAGLRDRLIHAYDRVDLATVWTTCQDDIPKLIAFVEPLVPTPPKAEP